MQSSMTESKHTLATCRSDQSQTQGTCLTNPRVGGPRTSNAILHSQETATRVGVGLTLGRVKGDFFEVKEILLFLTVVLQRNFLNSRKY